MKCQPKNTPWKIASFVAKARVQYVLQQRTPRIWGEWVRKELTTLGPAFIKMGQFLSTRSDLFDKEVATELAKLQDDITPIDVDYIHAILDESLGRPWSDVFTWINPEPLACASIGQVHAAKIMYKGKERGVVVKIQKPCVTQQITDDIKTLRMLNNVMMKLGSTRAAEVETILFQYETFLAAELDYTQEMQHMIRFDEILQDMPVRVPKVYKELCTNQILVMEYVPSMKISDIAQMRDANIDTTYIADTLVDIFLQMIVVHGYVHCDPHPGNIGVADNGDTIVLYDFGNVIELSKEFRSEINNLIFAVYQKDVDEFVDILVKIKLFVAADTLEIKTFFQSFFEYLESLDFATLRQSIQNQEAFIANMKFRIDPDFLGLFRVFSLLDGTCTRLDPNFNYIEALRPYTQDMFSDTGFLDYRAKKDLQKIQSYPKLMKSTEQSVLRVQKQAQQIATSVKYIEYMLMATAIVSQMDHMYATPLYIMIFVVWKSLSS